MKILKAIAIPFIYLFVGIVKNLTWFLNFVNKQLFGGFKVKNYGKEKSE